MIHVNVVLTNQVCLNITSIFKTIEEINTEKDVMLSVMILNKNNKTLETVQYILDVYSNIEESNIFSGFGIDENWKPEKIMNEVFQALPENVITEVMYIICSYQTTYVPINTHTRIIRYMYGLWDCGDVPYKMLQYKNISHSQCPTFRSCILRKNEIFDLVDERVLKMFSRIKRKVVLADICRYFMIWKLGGFYLDLDVIVNIDLASIVDACITSNQSVMLFTEHDKCDPRFMGKRENKEYTRRIYNCMFWSLPLHSFWKRCIELSVHRCYALLNENLTQWTDEDILWASGPDVVTTIYNAEFASDPSVKVYDSVISNKYLTHTNCGSWRNNHDCS